MGWAYGWRTMRSGSISGADTDLLCDFWQDTQEWVLPPLTGKNSGLALQEQRQRSCLWSWVRQRFLSKCWLTVLPCPTLPSRRPTFPACWVLAALFPLIRSSWKSVLLNIQGEQIARPESRALLKAWFSASVCWSNSSATKLDLFCSWEPPLNLCNACWDLQASFGALVFWWLVFFSSQGSYIIYALFLYSLETWRMCMDSSCLWKWTLLILHVVNSRNSSFTFVAVQRTQFFKIN